MFHILTQPTVLPGGLVIAMFLKLLPLMTSTWSRPVVPLQDSPSRSSGIPPCCMDWVEEALSLRDKLATSKRESPAYKYQRSYSNNWPHQNASLPPKNINVRTFITGQVKARVSHLKISMFMHNWPCQNDRTGHIKMFEKFGAHGIPVY